jgi:hypothetical protein
MVSKTEMKLISMKTGKTAIAIPVVTGFSNKKLDMFRIQHDSGRISSVDRDSIRRRYLVTA